ncbi:reverse transcriptase domain-containing protein [Tanacetum coccineum]
MDHSGIWVCRWKPKRKDTKVPQPSGPTDNVVDEVVYEEMDDSLERAATTATSLDAEQDRGNINKTKSKATLNEPSSIETSSGSGPRRQDTMGDTIAQTGFKNVSKTSNDSLLAGVNTPRSDDDILNGVKPPLDGYQYGNPPREALHLRGGPSTKLEQGSNPRSPSLSRLFKTWILSNHPKHHSISSKPDRAHICTISGAICGTATISPVLTKSYNLKTTHFSGMKNGREMTPPLGFSTPPHIPNNTTSERLPVTTTVFSATTPENMPFAYHDSTSTNPNPAIMRTTMKSERWNRGLSLIGKLLQPSGSSLLGSADNEKELWDSRMHQAGKETRGEGMLKVLGLQRLKRWKTQMGNPPAGGAFTYQGGYLPQAFTNNSIPSYNGPIHPTVTPSSSYPFYAQPMYALPNMHAYPNPAGPLVDSAGSVTPLVPGIEDYPLPDELKMPSHIGSYDGIEDPYNFLHFFKGDIRMQKWLMPIACHMFTYTLKDSARIWWNSQKAGSILNYDDLKAKFRSHFSQQKKFIKTHLAVHNIKQREGESTRAFIARYTDDTLTDDYDRKAVANENKDNATRPPKEIRRRLRIDLGPHNRGRELMEAGILREVKYQTWVSIPLVVKKDNGKWKMRVDFTNINKACIREPHPLPADEQKAEGLHKYRLQCFLDPYKGYHQIPIAEKDEEKQHFLQERGFSAIKDCPSA